MDHVKTALAHVRESLKSASFAARGGSVLGIDIGTSSIKIVQLAAERASVVLETYGEVATGPYLSTEAGRPVSISNELAADAIFDILHAVRAFGRRGGMAIPLSSALLFVMETLKRDEKMMQDIVPAEAKRFIPVPLESVTLDWQVIRSPKADTGAFDRMQSEAIAAGQKQQVLVGAVQNETLARYRDIASLSRLTIGYYEIEAFSAVRACAPPERPALLIDLGASATKMYLLNETGFVIRQHTNPGGGERLTETIMQSLGCDFATAEQLKRAHGINAISARTKEENEALSRALAHALDEIAAPIRTMLGREADAGAPVAAAVVIGGGARMQGIEAYLNRALGIPVTIGHPFERERAPLVLEDVLAEAGPMYAVAAGLALRGLRLHRHA